MNFLAVLDYEHLDNSMFLTAFAKALSDRKQRGLIIHGDSEYTERILQTGVMREEAQIRAIKDLNHRLVALFADQGISTTAVNGYQKSLVTVTGDHISIDVNQLKKLPEQPMVLISNLALDSQTNSPRPVPLADLSLALKNALKIQAITLFSINDSSNIIKENIPEFIDLGDADEKIIQTHIPKSFYHANFPVRLCTPGTFGMDKF